MQELTTYNTKGDLQVIIETPKGHRNKYNYRPDIERFELGGTLASGMVFPFDFGFIPATKGDDGDPLDVLVLMDEPAFTGCLVVCKLLGIIKAKQISRKENGRNDRLIAIPLKSHGYKNIDTIEDLPKNVIEEIIHFFVSYNDAKGVTFKPLGTSGPKEAMRIVEKGRKKVMR